MHRRISRALAVGMAAVLAPAVSIMASAPAHAEDSFSTTGIANFNGALYTCYVQDGTVNVNGPSPSGFGPASDAGCSLAGAGGHLYLAYANPNNSEIEVASVDIPNYNAKAVLSPGGVPEHSNLAPALAANGSTLYVAWTGTNSTLNASVLDNSQLQNNGGLTVRGDLKATLTNETSGNGPALTYDQGYLLIGWTGTSNRKLNVGAMSGGPNVVLSCKDTLAGELSDAPPGLTKLSGFPYLSWTGLGFDIDVLKGATNSTAGNGASICDFANTGHPVNSNAVEVTPALTDFNGHVYYTQDVSTGTLQIDEFTG